MSSVFHHSIGIPLGCCWIYPVAVTK
uniref:Uncharacterized protein n=1 Tax=Anguilla anguilla TaxID=7936 RepID=A0A0E9UGG0_ANGAN